MGRNFSWPRLADHQMIAYQKILKFWHRRNAKSPFRCKSYKIWISGAIKTFMYIKITFMYRSILWHLCCMVSETMLICTDLHLHMTEALVTCHSQAIVSLSMCTSIAHVGMNCHEAVNLYSRWMSSLNMWQCLPGYNEQVLWILTRGKRRDQASNVILNLLYFDEGWS